MSRPHSFVDPSSQPTSPSHHSNPNNLHPVASHSPARPPRSSTANSVSSLRSRPRAGSASSTPSAILTAHPYPPDAAPSDPSYPSYRVYPDQDQDGFAGFGEQYQEPTDASPDHPDHHHTRRRASDSEDDYGDPEYYQNDGNEDVDTDMAEYGEEGEDGDDGDREDGDDDDPDASGSGDDGEPTVKTMQEAINISHPFGLKIWKPALYRKFRSIDKNTHEALHSTPGSHPETNVFLDPGNILWLVVFGWWIALVYLVVAIVVLCPLAIVGWAGLKVFCCGDRDESLLSWRSPSRGRFSCWGLVAWIGLFFVELESLWQYSKVLINISGYMLWPFGKFIAKKKVYHILFQNDPESPDAVNERTGLLSDAGLAERDDVVIGVRDDDDVPYSSGATTAGASRRRRSGHAGNATTDDEASIRSEDIWSEYSFAARRGSRSSAHHPADSECTWLPRPLRRIIAAGLAANIFTVVLALLIAPLQLAITCMCSLFIFPIPMAKLCFVLLKHLLRHPLHLSAHAPIYSTGRRVSDAVPSTPVSTAHDSAPSRAPGLFQRAASIFWRPTGIVAGEAAAGRASIPQTLGEPSLAPPLAFTQGPPQPLAPEYHVVLCTYHAVGWEYYKYTVDGINIIFIK
ncbi:hypothetical protein BDK51DRAFT_31580 [Blyttiomyces helicus]|uniref:Uncharacterized protein n=1 Tax=Blyttiomyces helicus TaxID=388810 RepID=A0A4P9W610_9FUNG|nr:hypothetical protein BDK51DRAFT_31580 [Blyttiomyces helicus]|eukprot:RKO87402.1 hypothetical protein BDK51DRAFT_31580 [Blyttiomyces helicus]